MIGAAGKGGMQGQKKRSFLPWVVGGLAALVFGWVGHHLARMGITDGRVGFMEGWAILAVEQNPLGLAEGRRVFLALPQWLTALAAAVGLDYPARWLSALAGGVVVWFFFAWTHSLERRRGVRGALLWLACWLVLLQAGLWAGATGGSARVVLWMALLPAIGLLARYLLEMDRFVQARTAGRLSAWMEADGYLQGRLHFLWGAALLLAVAALAQPWVGVVGVVAWLPLAWLLLPPGERGQGAKVFTLWLLVFTPTVAAMAGVAYINLVFGGDPWLSFRHARELLLLMDPGLAIAGHQLPWRGESLFALAALKLGLVVSAPILIYLLVRVGNAGVALLFAVPWLVEAMALGVGHQLFEVTGFGFGQLSAILALLLAARFGRIGMTERWVCLAVILAATPLGWVQMAWSPQASDRALVELATGKVSAGEKRILADFLRTRPDLIPVVADERLAAPLIAELRSSQGVLTVGSRGYSTALFQSEVVGRSVLVGDPSYPVPGGLATDEGFVMVKMVPPEVRLQLSALPGEVRAVLWRRVEGLAR